jgi:hypothetical protein
MTLIETIFGAAVTGLGSGAGVAVGTYFSNKLVVEHLKKIEKKLKVKK